MKGRPKRPAPGLAQKAQAEIQFGDHRGTMLGMLWGPLLMETTMPCTVGFESTLKDTLDRHSDLHPKNSHLSTCGILPHPTSAPHIHTR